MKLMGRYFLTALFLVSASQVFAQGWTVAETGTQLDLQGVSFGAPGQVWACAGDGVILHSTDGGMAWEEQTNANQSILYGISFADSLHGVATGNDGTIVSTADGGITWDEVQTGFWMTYREAFQLDADHAWVCGQNTIFQPIVTWTTDGWGGMNDATFYVDNAEGGARDIYAINADTLVCVTRQWDNTGGLARSVNGGSTWTSSGTDPNPLYGVAFNTAGTGIAVGENGVILRSTDFGATWSPVTSPASYPLNDVDFASDSRVFIAGNGGHVLVSEDAGETWAEQATGASQDLQGISFIDENNGVAVGNFGFAMTTSTGGMEINHPPAPFARLTPEDDAEMDRTVPVEFSWQASSDVDGDDIVYTIAIDIVDYDETYEQTLVDTTFSFDFEPLQLPGDAIAVAWSVFATDGEDTTFASNVDGQFSLAEVNAVGDGEPVLPAGYRLHNAYPNPFNAMTAIRYETPVAGAVHVAVFNLLGEQIATLVDRQVAAGSHLAVWKGRDSSGVRVSSGTYIVRMDAGDTMHSLRVTLVK